MVDIFGQVSSSTIILIVLLLAGDIAVSRLLRELMNRLSERYVSRRIAIKNLIPLVGISLHISVLLYILFGVLQITTDTLLAVGVSAAVAIGFAIQDILANAFGGLVIIFSRPFNIGDKITIGGFYGEVVDISLLQVKINTLDDSMISVPSKTFLQSSTSNANAGELDCQVVTKIVVPGGLDGVALRDLAKFAVYSSPYTFLKKPVIINLADHFHYASSTEIIVKAYVFDHRYEGRFASDVTERIQAELRRRSLIPNEFYRLGLSTPGGPR